MAGASWHLGGR